MLLVIGLNKNGIGRLVGIRIVVRLIWNRQKWIS